MAATLTLQNSVTWAQQFLRLRPLNLGASNEPAITSANLVRQVILGPPFRWRWNRASTGFFSVVGQMEYCTLRWAATQAVNTTSCLVDPNSNAQVATTGGTTGSSQPSWNPTQGQTTNDGGVIWTNQGRAPGETIATGFNQGDPATFLFIDHASTQSMPTDLPASAWCPLESKLGLELDSTPGAPRTIAAEGDTGNGQIIFRLAPVPDQTYPVSVTWQQKAPLFTALSGLWAPIPDEFSYLYNWGFLALMMLFSDDARFPVCNQKFVAHLLSAQQGLTATQINIFLNSWMAITGQPEWNALRMNQGSQAQGT